MRRIDAIAIILLLFLVGGATYLLLQWLGLDQIKAGIWSQALMVFGILAWLGTYLVRVGTKKMTYNQQLQDYEEAVLEKRLEEMSPEELAKLKEELTVDS